ncbi:beta-ketoacyl-[acyl-carrier-protein] synthase family protein [Odoribacter sp. OttesenSCG-928-L07]|nr:beta-ketoacyl-[acyl-carrier-protein] synthase family protein [Odoribacter sp. OttesenSCG-928-L07]MDL2238905.1 beta-ketoacyl-[acyl-carrier-protein] synthase family protein [Bacteroidales bacterium OttesenSCG-928-L14]MDL2240645.1 beta-ketoacyl-[acyl-carrier-protein] synthase family protein [Bacteroidales bacterium OttesenSCG-928-K22]
MRRVVVTGVGIYSCIGKNISEVTESLKIGKSGIGIDEKRIEYGYRSPLTGIVERPILKGILDRRTRACLAEEGEYAYMATKEALDNAGVNDEYLDNNEIGIFYGNDSSAKAIIEAHAVAVEKKDTMLMGSGAIFQSMNSTVTMNLAVIFRLKGISMTISAACASGSHSTGLGYMFIKNGLQDMVICGGAQETNFYSMGSFDALSAFSVRVNEPEKASRPFDSSRDGLVPSGGAATLILEEYEHAVKRGANIIAEITGYGFSSNGIHISQPNNVGSAIAMDRAMKDANINAKDIDYINAHATSTPLGDMYEAMAIDSIFNKYKTPVSSTKSMTGHECWMAGASELIYSLIMMRNNFIAPNINFETPDEYSAKINIISEPTKKELRTIISNSFGFGGTNSAIILKDLDK